MEYTVRPISDRTAFAGKHTESQFAVKYGQVIELLEKELRFLKATNIVIEVDVTESQIRLDGLMRNDARASSPAVRLAFDSTVGPLTYASDAFVRGQSVRYVGAYDSPNRKKVETMRQDWQHNLYAIAKSLEALRLVDRYGVTKRGEQYAGFKALPAGRAMPSSHMTTDAAWTVLADVLGDPAIGVTRGDAEAAALAVKLARRQAHPDRRGDRKLWDQVEQAAVVLGVSS